MGLCYVALLSCVRLLSSCPSVHPLLLHERLPVRARVGGRDGEHVLLNKAPSYSKYEAKRAEEPERSYTLSHD